MKVVNSSLKKTKLYSLANKREIVQSLGNIRNWFDGKTK